MITPFERATISDYDVLIAAFRDRLNEMQINHLDFGKLAGLSNGLVGKLVGDARTKTIGFQSLWFILDALALRFELVSDPEMLAANEQRYEKCVSNKRVLDRAPTLGKALVRRVASQTGAMAKGVPKAFRISTQELAAIRSKAATASWKRRKKRLREALKAQRTTVQNAIVQAPQIEARP